MGTRNASDLTERGDSQERAGTLLPAVHADRPRSPFLVRLRAYWALIKSLQTGLLVKTGLAGYLSARPEPGDWPRLLALAASLTLAVAGSTVLNMVCDRDIDGCMQRTAGRPLPRGRVDMREALLLGLVLTVAGVAWAAALSPLCGLCVLAGAFFDVVVYSAWLKRRTPWSIVWGGVAGGMPVLAGRVLGVGRIDAVGLLLALAILLWIPTHVLTFSRKHAADYARAGVPVLPNTHGLGTTRLVLGISTGVAVVVMSLTIALIGLRAGFLQAVWGLGAILLIFAGWSALRPSPRLNSALYKLASVYMLGAMGLIIVGV